MAGYKASNMLTDAGLRPGPTAGKSSQIAAGLIYYKSAGLRPVKKLTICWQPTVGEAW
jgi:hypothetical protein